MATAKSVLFLFIAAGLTVAFFEPQSFLEVDESPSVPRALTVVPPATANTDARASKLERMADAYKALKGRTHGSQPTKKAKRKLALDIPAVNMGMSVGQNIGKVVNWLPSKLKLNLANNPQEEASLGLGVAALAYGKIIEKRNARKFEELHSALQNKYQMNGVYLASLEDENIQMRYCNKRLQKILDKSARHRKDMLAKLHLSISPGD